jgi:hypothetical protein
MHDPRRRVMLLAGGALVSAGLVLGLLVLVFGARLDAPTVALAAAAATLVYALGQLYTMVWALSRPERIAQVGQAAGSFSQGELRDEKRRLLRAIKELEFDHGMGKLSTGDFEAVIATYRLRAIEVMRALEGGASLHPELAKLLAERGQPGQADGAVTGVAPTLQAPLGALDETTRLCNVCGRTNDSDARFCKHCGAGIKSDELKSRDVQAPRTGEIGGAP